MRADIGNWQLVAMVPSSLTGRGFRSEGSMSAKAGRVTLLISMNAAAIDVEIQGGEGSQ